MTRLPFCVGFALSLGVGCRTGDDARPPTARASAPPQAASATSALTLSSDVQTAGLRIRSGALAARVVQGAPTSTLWGFTDVALDGGRTRLEVAQRRGGAVLSDLLPEGALAVVNGGYFEADFRPSTWLMAAGRELSPKSDTSKGGVLALGSAGLYLGPFAGLHFKPELAVQSFPLLVEAEGRSGVYRDDGRRAARTVACLVGDTLHFIVISAPRGDGPTLFETAGLLRAPPPAGFGCRRALNLDGGPSTGIRFAPALQAKQRPPLAKVGYALVILPR